MVLGELEKQVLTYFWRIDSADAKQVHAFFEKRRGGSLNTIQSTLDRLFKKKLLERHKEGHAFIYRAALAREQFIGDLIKNLARDFSADDDDSLLAAFVSLSAQLNIEHLDRLECLIQDFRAQHNPDKPA